MLLCLPSKVSSLDALINMSLYILLHCINNSLCITFSLFLWGPGFEWLLVCFQWSTGWGLIRTCLPVTVFVCLNKLLYDSHRDFQASKSDPLSSFGSSLCRSPWQNTCRILWVKWPGGSKEWTILNKENKVLPSRVSVTGTRESSGGLNRLPHYCSLITQVVGCSQCYVLYGDTNCDPI